MPDWFNQAAGISAIRTASHRALFLQRSETFLAQGRYLDGSLSRDPGNADITNLRIGLILGKVTSTGRYAPSILGTTTVATAAADTIVTMSAAVATELVRRVGTTGTFKLTGPAAANGITVTETVTYSAVNTTTGVATVTALAGAHVLGSFVQPTDGSDEPTTFIPDTQAYGVYVLDQNNNNLTNVELPRMPVSGTVDSPQLLPTWPSDTSLQTWLINRLNGAAGGQFVFDNRY